MATWDRYKQATTGFETKSFLGDIFTIRSYCDIHGGGVYVTKEPICKLLVAPLSVFINVNFSWDISQSGSESGTLDTYDIDFDGPTSGGDISSAAWAGAKTGTNQYTSAGHFTIVASVTDTLGKKSKEVRIPVIAIDGGDEGDEQSLQRIYIGTTDSGCWIMTPTVEPAPFNTGLSGDDLKFRQLKVSPYTADGDNSQHLLLAATKTGLAYSLDGAANWSLISKAALGDPKNTAGDGTPPVTADLDQIAVSFDPRDSRRWYAKRTNATRTWFYWSDDSGASWENEQVNRFGFDSTIVILTGGGNALQFSHAKLDTDKSIALFDDAGSFGARVIDISAGIALGALSSITGDSGDVDQADTDKAIVAYNNSGTGTVRAFTVITTTITQQAATTFDTSVTSSQLVRVGITPDGTKGVVAYTKTGIGMRLCRITISGNTITADTPVTHNTHTSFGAPLSLSALDNDRILFWYSDNDPTEANYHAQVIDVSGTISQGAVVDLASDTFTSTDMPRNALTTLSDSLGFAIFLDEAGADPDILYVVDINVSGSSITLGTPLVADGSVRSGVDKLSATRALSARGIVTSTTIQAQAFNVEDGEIQAGSFATLPAYTSTPSRSLPIFTGNNKAIMIFRNSDTGECNAVTLFLAPDLTHSAGGIPGSILI